MDNREIGQRLKIARTLKSMSQSIVGKKINCDQSRLSRLENGEIPILATDIYQLAKIYKTNVMFFFQQESAENGKNHKDGDGGKTSGRV